LVVVVVDDDDDDFLAVAEAVGASPTVAASDILRKGCQLKVGLQSAEKV